MTIKVTKTKTIDLSGLHDVMVDVLEDRRYTDDEVQKCFDSLPEDIQMTAFEWGSGDTVFGDEAYKFLKQQKGKNQMNANVKVPITEKMVLDLRDKYNMPLNKCKEALVKSNGDEIKAIRLLRSYGSPNPIKGKTK